MKRPEKYVVLEHLTLPDRELRFWTMNTVDNIHSAYGDIWYKEVLFTDDEDIAKTECREGKPNATYNELYQYYKNTEKR